MLGNRTDTVHRLIAEAGAQTLHQLGRRVAAPAGAALPREDIERDGR